MVLMEVKDGDKILHRCDAKCYSAKGQDCHCCCGGLNHGIGFDAAMKNMKEKGNEILNDYSGDGEAVLKNIAE
ncbi:MAG TPA: hypothetical protein VMZ91_05295 [Candidatus Paceibacterota bacterium]|nr:hypothetical protein [Candidatus Paceibacterota bacterium]